LSGFQTRPVSGPEILGFAGLDDFNQVHQFKMAGLHHFEFGCCQATTEIRCQATYKTRTAHGACKKNSQSAYGFRPIMSITTGLLEAEGLRAHTFAITTLPRVLGVALCVGPRWRGVPGGNGISARYPAPSRADAKGDAQNAREGCYCESVRSHLENQKCDLCGRAGWGCRRRSPTGPGRAP